MYLLCGDVSSIGGLVAELRELGKTAIVNIDLVAGLGKDATAVGYLADRGVDGIISTHVEPLRAARGRGILAVQRSFLLDSLALANAVRAIERFRPDAVELLPAPVAPRAVAAIGRVAFNLPLIAGGLVESMREVDELLRNGVSAVSASNSQLWS